MWKKGHQHLIALLALTERGEERSASSSHIFFTLLHTYHHIMPGLVGTVTWSEDAPVYDTISTISVWRCIKGTLLDEDDPWNLRVLYNRAWSKNAGQLSLKSSIPEPKNRAEEFWGYDIDRSRLPSITHTDLPVAIPFESDGRHQRCYEIEVVKWLYPREDAECILRTIIHFDMHLRNIIEELAKAPRLHDVLMDTCLQSKAHKKKTLREQKIAQKKRENGEEVEPDCPLYEYRKEPEDDGMLQWRNM
jgi:hypothetical protein